MANELNLSNIFGSVTQQLAQKQETLNEADDYNHNHGDHMVQIFNLIQGAVSQKQDQPVAEQLGYASKVVKEQANSGSAALYAQNLSNAAQKFSGSELKPDMLGTLVQSLLGVEKPQPAPQPKQTGGFLGSLLSSLTGKKQTSQQDQGLDLNDLLQVGMAFYQSKQEGDNNTQAIMDALMAASPMGQSAHRAQSGSVVASTILDFAKSLNQ